MGDRYIDPDGNVWEVVSESGRYVTLRNPFTRDTQEVSVAELRECFEEDANYSSSDEAW